MRDIENIMAYLPNIIIEHLMVDKLKYPDEQKFKTVCLFADVSGFTALSEKLCNEGPDGIEELASQLNKYMGQIVKLTSRAGGDVLKFAGDAMFAVWPPDDSDRSPEKLGTTVLRAIQCCIDMQARLRDFKFVFRNRDAEGRENGSERLTGQLSVKLGIGIGDVSIYHIGGESDNVMSERFDYVAIGQALEEAFHAEACARAGQTVISKAAYNLVKAQIAAELIPDSAAKDNKHDKCYLVHKMKDGVSVRWKKKADEFTLVPSAEIQARVWKCVPAAVLPYLNDVNEYWAPEVRRVTTLFCNLGYREEELAADNIDLEAIGQVFKVMQQSVFQFEGTINKFLVDDKGSSLIVVFGLPPFAHENDATRGVLSAMSILASLHELGKEGSIGLTTGEAFCGVVGARGNRREYSVIGDSINVAARLMMEAKKRGCGHLMDKNTWQAVKDDHLQVKKFGDVLLKGKQAEIPVYQVSGDVLDVARITGLPSPRSVTPKRVAAVSTSATPPAPADRKKKKTGKVEKQISFDDPQPTSLATINMASAQRVQIAAITEAPALRKMRDIVLKGRVEQLTNKDKAAHLARGLESFAQQTQKGLQMGSGRARSPSDLLKSGGASSPAPMSFNSSRTIKAAQITFNNCATPSGSKAGELSTTFTLPLVNGIENFYDLKDAALIRLAGRQLLARGPEAKRHYFSLKWKEAPAGRDTEIINEKERLDDVKDLTSPIIQLILVEHQHPTRAAAGAGNHSKSSMVSESQQSTSSSGVLAISTSSGVTNTEETTRDTVVIQLETVRNNLFWGDGSGKVVVLEGAQGVGKTKLAADVFLKPDVAVGALTGVAMGNPYETERLSSPLSVWAVLTKQLLEEALTLRRILSGQMTVAPQSGDVELSEADITEIHGIAQKAMKKFDPRFGSQDALDALISSLLRDGHLPGVRSSMNMEEEPGISRAVGGNGTTGPLRSMIAMIVNLILGLSMEVAPVVVLIDDSHYMDVASWYLALKLADSVAERKAPMAVVLLHRNLILAEMFSAVGTENSDILDGVDRHNMRAIDNKHTRNRREVSRLYNELLSRDHVLHVEKKSHPERTDEIIKEFLQVDAVPEELGKLLKKKSQGNALFIRDALSTWQEEKLMMVTSKTRTLTLTEAFSSRSKDHDLPIPPSVEGICATLLDTMSITQQMALKVAAIIGETFTLRLIKEVFPIAHLAGGLEQEWDALVRLGIVTDYERRGVGETVFKFSNGWMLETLRKRMLGKQRRRLVEMYKAVDNQLERQRRLEFMNKSVQVERTGWLMVRKDHARNMLQPWKKRWVVLKDDELIQLYDEVNPKKLEVIKLGELNTSTSIVPGGYAGYEANLGEKQFSFCFTVQAPKWIKKGNLQSELRTFYMACESEKELSDWVFKINWQIEYYALRTENTSARDVPLRSQFEVYRNLPQLLSGDTGSHISSVAGVRKMDSSADFSPMPPPEPSSGPGSFLAKITGGSRKSLLAPAPSHTISVRARGRSHLPIQPSPRTPSGSKNGDVALGMEFENPGSSIVPMTAAHFKAISRDEALATFWASDDTTLDDVLVLRSSHHVSWFYEFGDMALVSLNGQGAIDGYLLGFVSSRTPDHAVVHQCAVVPAVRRHGVGTKLYQKFFELAKKRGCHWVRSLVPRDSLGAIAFHRQLNFDELGGEDWLTDDMIVFIRELHDA